MPLLDLRSRSPRAADPWIVAETPSAAAADTALLLPLPVLVATGAALRSRPGPLGALVEPDADPAALDGWCARLDLIALRFAFPHDGRPYSLARMLRERAGFRRELRAIGAVVLDLAPYLAAAGFDTAEMPAVGLGDRAHLEAIRMPRVYDPADPLSIWRARHGEWKTGEVRSR